MVALINTAPFAHLYPFESNYLEIDGLDYHYLDEGAGEPMLMVHGNPTWSFYFRALVSAFSGDRRVIVPDHIGCGLSAKPPATRYPFNLQRRVEDLSALMDHLALTQPVTLVVHDWGGMIGLSWALENLQAVARIVIMNSAAFFPPHGRPLPKRLRAIRNGKALMQSMVLGLNLFARAALYMAPHRRLPTDVKAGLIAPYNSRRNRLATLEFVRQIPLSVTDPGGDIVARVDRGLRKICSRPTLILWGARDFVFDRAYFDAWRCRLPDAEAHWFEDAGHYLLEDIPEKIVGHMQRFLL